MANAVVRGGEVPHNAALEESASLVMNITRNAYQDQHQHQLSTRLQATLNQLHQQPTTTTMPVVKTVLLLAIGIVVNQVAPGQAKRPSQAQ